jgi:tetratricopeptide (TPR) repeat protein
MLIELLRKAFGRTRPARADPDAISAALELESAGHPAEARRMLRAALDAGAVRGNALLRTLARLEAQGGDAKQAVTLLTEAAAGDPGSAGTLCDLGNAYLALNAEHEAETAYLRALEADSEHVIALNNLGLLRARRGERDAALECFRRAFRLDPRFTPALDNLVAWLPDTAVPHADIAMLRELTARAPGHAGAHAALGALLLRGAFDAEPALAALDHAIALGLDDSDVHTRRGVALHELGRAEEALTAFERALAHDPGCVAARFHRAIALLALGRFAEGWPDYELRLRSEDRPQRAIPGVRWHGEPLNGRALLVYAEQGVGDEICFASCLPDVIRAAGQCIVECDVRLADLYRRSFPDATVVGGSQHDPIVPPPHARVDLHVPLASLPGYVRRNLADFPRETGYLRPDSGRTAVWRDRLATLGPGIPVGIAWRGGTLRSRGPARSLDLAHMSPLLATPGVRWVSLQRGVAPGEIEGIERALGIRVHTVAETLEDLDETAALLGALALIVTTDSTVAQLAGATGCSVWVLLPVGAEWRYGVTGERLPWYPSARLFRQVRRNDWSVPLETAATALREVIGAQVD